MRQVGDQRGTEHQELAVGTATKLIWTFSTQLDALKRYRAGRENNVTIKHVLVKEDGQKVVVRQVPHTRSRRAALKKADETLALTDSRQPAMPDLDGEKEAWLEYAKRKESHS